MDHTWKLNALITSNLGLKHFLHSIAWTSWCTIQFPVIWDAIRLMWRQWCRLDLSWCHKVYRSITTYHECLYLIQAQMICPSLVFDFFIENAPILFVNRLPLFRAVSNHYPQNFQMLWEQGIFLCLVMNSFARRSIRPFHRKAILLDNITPHLKLSYLIVVILRKNLSNVGFSKSDS